MVVTPTIQTVAESGLARRGVPLNEARAQIVEVVDAVGVVRDAAHLQHCLFLAQEFRLLPERSYWFAPDGPAALPYSHILDAHIRDLLTWGVLQRAAYPADGYREGITAPNERRAVPPPTTMGLLAALSDLTPDDVALFAGLGFQLSRRGCHPAQARFCADLSAALRDVLSTYPDDNAAEKVEVICAVCRRLGLTTQPHLAVFAS